jgi:dienelactone hydrolase
LEGSAVPTIALFHSVLGVRPGVNDAADRLRAAGHDVHIIDQYDGQVFDDYEEADAFAESIGFPALMAAAVDAVNDLEDGFVAMGFSNGAGMATHVSVSRKVRATVLCSGALPLEMIGAEAWPNDVPVQLHYAVDDPFRVEKSVRSLLRSVNEAGSTAEYMQYPGRGHLFTDESLPNEYDAVATTALWTHVVRFLQEHTS